MFGPFEIQKEAGGLRKQLDGLVKKYKINRNLLELDADDFCDYIKIHSLNKTDQAIIALYQIAAIVENASFNPLKYNATKSGLAQIDKYMSLLGGVNFNLEIKHEKSKQLGLILQSFIEKIHTPGILGVFNNGFVNNILTIVHDNFDRANVRNRIEFIKQRIQEQLKKYESESNNTAEKGNAIKSIPTLNNPMLSKATAQVLPDGASARSEADTVTRVQFSSKCGT